MIYNNKFCSHCINLYNLLTQVFVGFVNVSNDQESDINVTELNNVEEEKPVLNPSPKICETVQTVKLKPFICELCKSCYTNASGLSRHKKDRHLSNGQIHCTFHGCRKVFRDSTSEKTHFASKHRSEIKTQVPKKIQCKICKTIFETNHQLYIHKGRCKGGLQPPLVSVKNYPYRPEDNLIEENMELCPIY